MAPTIDPKNALTDRERELMAYAWLCFSEKPKPDYKKLAALAGMSNPVSASNAWSKIQKKITAQVGDVSADGTPEVQTPKATPAKKRAAAAKSAAVDGESPAKKTKATPSKAKKVVKDEPVDDESDLSRELSREQSEVEGQGEEEQSFF